MSDIRWYAVIIAVLGFLAILTIAATAATENDPFFKDKMIPNTNVPCCNKKDCKAGILWRQKIDGEYEIYILGKWHTPQQNIIRHQWFNDGMAKACYTTEGMGAYASPNITVFCVWIPIMGV